MHLVGRQNVANFLPLLKIRKKTQFYVEIALNIARGFMREIKKSEFNGITEGTKRIS